MAFCRTIIHVVQPGDTFYRLAQRYQTTVPDIIQRNPGVNPYNLQVGTRLNICSGQEQDHLQQDELDLNNDMRQSWAQHVFWTMIFQNALFNSLPNQENVENRLMQTPEDIGAVFERFYSQSMVRQLTQLLSEHTRLAGEIMAAMKANDMTRADQLERQWRQNADNIARLLAGANTKYSYDELQQMLNRHLDMLKRQMQAGINKEFDEEIRVFDEGENLIAQLADYLTGGLLQQFYQP